MIEFKRAERKKAKLRLGISAASGAGKTYSALQIAMGLVDNFTKIALIDTESGSGELYSHICAYACATIRPPFTPDKYIEAIKAAEKTGFEVIIIDSLSHAWSGEGGMLEMVDKATQASKSGNSYTAWRSVTPKHNQLIDTILQSPCHMIITTRAKTEYVIVENDKGRKEPKKIGLAPVFRDGLEYEMTCFFDMSHEHLASASKDRTGLFDGTPFKPTRETGEKLRGWLENGAEVKEEPKVETPKQEMKPEVTTNSFKPEPQAEATLTIKQQLTAFARQGQAEMDSVKEVAQEKYPDKLTKDLTDEEALIVLEEAISRVNKRENQNA